MKRRREWIGLLFIFPSFSGLLFFSLVPYINVFKQSVSQIATERFVGLDNFINVLKNEAFKLAATNTSRLIVLCIPLLIFLSLGIAVFIKNKILGSEIFKKSILIPMAIPVISLVLVWRTMFEEQGFLNKCLSLFGINPINWIDSKYALFILCFSYIWKNLGYCTILWLSGLASISEEIYEAARVDGAGDGKSFIYITLPNIKSMLFINTMLSLINSFKVFREAYLVAGDYPHHSIYLFQHLFNNWFRNLEIEKISAGAVMLGMMVFLLVLVFWKFWWGEEGKYDKKNNDAFS